MLPATLPRNRRWTMTGLALMYALAACACSGGGSSGAPATQAAPPTTQTPTPDPTPQPDPTPTPAPTPDCQTRDIYTLCVTIQQAGVSAETLEHMTELFFDVYPRLADRFNRAAPLSVYFVIGPSSYIASASGNTVTYQTAWLVAHPQDYDVVVHEVMHVVQSYSSAPGWLTEGIADYVRYYYGVNNAAAGWQLQPLVAGASYTSGYTVAARFFIWVESRYEIDLVTTLDAALRGGSYDPALWVSLTGKTVDDLWSEYLADPAFEIPPAAPAATRTRDLQENSFEVKH